MVFNSVIFIFCFLPIFLLIYYFVPARARNPVLFAGSLFFYAWGDPTYLVLMLFSSFFNYYMGKELGKITDEDPSRKRNLIFAVVINLLILGFFNIMFAWLGLLCFFIPLIIALVQGNKGYCNRYCGRGQLFGLLGGRLGLSRKKDIPGWMKSRAFRYGFLVFFLIMFCQMLWNTVLVFTGASDLKQVVTLLWIFKLPWHWAYHGTLFHPGTAQFAFGFYSVMLTSTILGLITMVLFKPRSWCVYCPMGTMTQLICKGKNGKK